MATVINAGRVAMVPKGEWASATAYTRLDVVLYNGSSWVATADSTGQVPGEGSTYWQMLAQGFEGGGKPADVTFTITQNGSAYTSDMTYAEIQAALSTGATVLGAFSTNEFFVVLSIVGGTSNNHVFAALYGSYIVAFSISASGVTRIDVDLATVDDVQAVAGYRITAVYTNGVYIVSNYEVTAMAAAYNSDRYCQLTFSGGEFDCMTLPCVGYYFESTAQIFLFAGYAWGRLMMVELHPNGALGIDVLDLSSKADKTLATSTIPVTGLLPNVVYDYGTTDTVSVTLAAGEAGVANIWCFVFTAQTAACTVTLPSSVVLGNEYAWDMVAGRRYEVSIMDNVAIVNYSD